MPTTTPATGFTIAITCITWKQGWRILWPIGKDQLKDGGDGYLQLVFLFLGILCIGLVYAKTDNHRISHHVFFAIILLLFLVIFFTIHHHFQKTCVILIAGNLDQMIRLIRSWGVAAPLMSLLLMVIQAIVAPLPAFLVTAANGMIFGSFWGAVLSWTGTLMGALTSFCIARLVGNVAVRMEEHPPILLTYTAVFIFILIVFSLVQGVHKKT